MRVIQIWLDFFLFYYTNTGLICGYFDYALPYHHKLLRLPTVPVPSQYKELG